MKPQPTDITIRDVETSHEHHAYRTPLKFGGVPVTHCTLLNVRVRTRTGRVIGVRSQHQTFSLR